MSAGTFDPAFNPPRPRRHPRRPRARPGRRRRRRSGARARADARAPALTRAVRALGLLAAEGARSASPGGPSARAITSSTTSPTTRCRRPRASTCSATCWPAPRSPGSWGWWRSSGAASGASTAVERVARRLAPLCLAGLLPLFFQWQLWYGGRELTFMVMVSAFVLGLQVLTRVSLETPPILPASLRARVGARLGPPLARVRDTKWLPFAIVFAALPRLHHLLLDHHHPEPLPPADDGVGSGDREQPGLERRPLQPAAVQDLGHRQRDVDPPRVSRDLYLVPDRDLLPAGAAARDAAGAAGGADRRRRAAVLRLRAPSPRRLDRLPAGGADQPLRAAARVRTSTTSTTCRSRRSTSGGASGRSSRGATSWPWWR